MTTSNPTEVAEDRRSSPADTTLLRHVPVTARDRWMEIVETSHDGVAILDAQFRVTFASDRFARALGQECSDVIGRPVEQVIPELSDLESRVIDRAQPLRLEHRCLDDQGSTRSLRLTLVPREVGDLKLGTIILQEDITDVRRAQAERHRTERRLTAIEEEEHRRLSREIHDGPIQLLAALALRLGAIAEPGEPGEQLRALKGSVAAASADLRSILRELTTGDEQLPSTELLQRWIAPVLAGSHISLDLEDTSTVPPTRATTEALFITLYEVVNALLHRPEARSVTARIDDASSGYKLAILIDRMENEHVELPSQLAQLAAIAQHAASLEGSFEVEWQPPDTRILTLHLAQLDEDGHPFATTPAQAPGSSARVGVDLRGPAKMASATEADWEALARASHEGLMEVDAALRITYVNQAYEAAMKRPAAELLGRHLSEVFTADDYARILPNVRSVEQGHAIRFDWERRNAAAEPRWTRVSASPRHDEHGTFAGALLVTLDTTDVHTIEELHLASRSHLRQIHRSVERWFVRRLNDGPLQRLQDVVEQLAVVAEMEAKTRGKPNRPLDAIRESLEASITDMRGTVRLLGDPDLTTKSWLVDLRRSLRSMLDSTDVKVSFTDRTRNPPPDSIGTTLARIGREAVANAILHGRPDSVLVTLSDHEHGYLLDVRDDGTGIDTTALDPTDGHLGLRSMRERAVEQMGRFAIGPGEDGGTHVTAWLPTLERPPIITNN